MIVKPMESSAVPCLLANVGLQALFCGLLRVSLHEGQHSYVRFSHGICEVLGPHFVALHLHPSLLRREAIPAVPPLPQPPEHVRQHLLAAFVPLLQDPLRLDQTLLSLFPLAHIWLRLPESPLHQFPGIGLVQSLDFEKGVGVDNGGFALLAEVEAVAEEAFVAVADDSVVVLAFAASLLVVDQLRLLNLRPFLILHHLLGQSEGLSLDSGFQGFGFLLFLSELLPLDVFFYSSLVLLESSEILVLALPLFFLSLSVLFEPLVLCESSDFLQSQLFFFLFHSSLSPLPLLLYLSLSIFFSQSLLFLSSPCFLFSPFSLFFYLSCLLLSPSILFLPQPFFFLHQSIFFFSFSPLFLLLLLLLASQLFHHLIHLHLPLFLQSPIQLQLLFPQLSFSFPLCLFFPLSLNQSLFSLAIFGFARLLTLAAQLIKILLLFLLIVEEVQLLHLLQSELQLRLFNLSLDNRLLHFEDLSGFWSAVHLNLRRHRPTRTLSGSYRFFLLRINSYLHLQVLLDRFLLLHLGLPNLTFVDLQLDIPSHVGTHIQHLTQTFLHINLGVFIAGRQHDGEILIGTDADFVLVVVEVGEGVVSGQMGVGLVDVLQQLLEGGLLQLHHLRLAPVDQLYHLFIKVFICWSLAHCKSCFCNAGSGDLMGGEQRRGIGERRQVASWGYI